MPTTLPSHDNDHRWHSLIALVVFSMVIGIGLLTLDRVLRPKAVSPRSAEVGTRQL